MRFAFPCPHCEQASQAEITPSDASFSCANCGQEIAVPDDAFAGDELRRCLACPSHDLFTRKDFPQRLGVTLVVLGFVASSIAWYFYLTYLTFAILFATALVDVVLYVVVGDSLMCYRCGAVYRGALGHEKHGAFDLVTHERHRQQVARLAEHAAATKVRS